MDELNMNHILAPNVQEIGHGVRLSGQDQIDSRRLVCFLDRQGGLHYGFAYRNGSNLRVVCWENNNRKNKTVNKGTFIIAFDEVITDKTFNNVDANDFQNLPWFQDNQQQNVRDELLALIDKHDRLNDLIEGLAGLTIQEMDRIIETMNEVKGN